MSTQNLDYAYIEKLKNKSERQLQTMLNNIEKETIQIKLEKSKLENKLKDKIKKSHFIKDALMERWRMPSDDLLEAMQELENGGGITCKTMKDFDRVMAE